MLDFYYIAEMRDGGEKSGRLPAPNPQTVYEIAKLRHKQATRIHVIPPMVYENLMPVPEEPEEAPLPKGGRFLLEQEVLGLSGLKFVFDLALIAGVVGFAVYFFLLN